NYGKGHAIREGIARSTGRYVVFIDADLDIHPAQLDDIIDTLKHEKCDIAIGSKRHPDSKVVYPRSRRFISTVYYWIVKLLFGLNVKDTQAGLKIYKREVLQSIMPRLIVKKFAFDLEMLVAARKLGYDIIEFPIKVIFSRKYGRINLKDCWMTGMDTLAVFYRHRLLDFYSYPAPINDLKPGVSVILPVARPNENLKRCIEACLSQDYENFEIIVLPDALPSTSSAPYLMHHKISVVPTGPVNPSVKRNMGAARASGDILAFLDDDALPHYSWMNTGVRHFGNEGVAAVGGPAVTPPGSSMEERISGHIFASPLVSGPYRYRYIPHRFQEVDDYPSCNFFISSEIFNHLGGFSSQHWPGEDTLICRDIRMKTGKKILYDPHLIVDHRRRAVFSDHLNQVRRYALHRGYFAKRWPENSLKPGYFFPSILTCFIVCGLPLSFIPFFKWMYLTGVGIYFAMALMFSIRLNSPRETALTAYGIFATHLTYCIFFLAGLALKGLPEHKPVFQPLFQESVGYKAEGA
ncbi:MAG: glycosyltransferase, partial [Deltaproteobacteria bacterium]|nr:glycosyltransferase [Deltaproteobacteria bacterium]